MIRIIPLLTCMTITIYSQPDGVFEASFGANGQIVTTLSGGTLIRIDSEGRVLVFNSESVSRFLPSGLIDTSFGTNGTVDIAALFPDIGALVDLNIQFDKKILVLATQGVVRLLESGVVDTSYNNGRVF